MLTEKSSYGNEQTTVMSPELNNVHIRVASGSQCISAGLSKNNCTDGLEKSVVAEEQAEVSGRQISSERWHCNIQDVTREAAQSLAKSVGPLGMAVPDDDTLAPIIL